MCECSYSLDILDLSFKMKKISRNSCVCPSRRVNIKSALQLSVATTTTKRAGAMAPIQPTTTTPASNTANQKATRNIAKMENRKENVPLKQVDVVDEIERVDSKNDSANVTNYTTLKTRDALAEGRQSDSNIKSKEPVASLPVTPERPRSSLRYNTPITPEPTNSRPPLPAPIESETILSLGEELHDLSLNSESSSGLGLGVFTGGKAIQIQRRTSNTRPFPLRQHKARLPSWHATSKGPESIICEGLEQIVNFSRNVSSSTNSASVDFKLFLDANKEIVRAWRMMEEGEIKRNVVLGEKVDCIIAILAAWGNKDVDVHGNWVQQAIQLTEIGVEFAREWEVVTGVRVGKFGAIEESLSPEKRKDVFTSLVGGAESDESMGYIAPRSILVESPLEKEVGKLPEDNGSPIGPKGMSHSPIIRHFILSDSTIEINNSQNQHVVLAVLVVAQMPPVVPTILN
jgi:hypothetical protein